MRTPTLVLSGLLLVNLGITALLYYRYYPGAAMNDSAQVELNTSFSTNADGTPASDTRTIFDQEKFGPVYATVNTLSVRQLELLPYLGEIMPTKQFQSLQRFDEIPEKYLSMAMQSIAIDALLDDEARNKGMYADPSLQSAIRQYSRRYMRAAYLNSISPALVTDDEIKDVYDKLAAELNGKREYHARHILLASEKEARVISEALTQKKKTFAELAKLYSLDNVTSFNGGDLGFNVEGQLQAQFEAVVKQLPLQQYSRPFKTDLGWHIAVVDERRDSKPLPYDEAAPAIRLKLEQEAVNSYVESMLTNATISVSTLNADTDSMANKPVSDE